ncbi:hypothetical protein KVV02_008693 [Mortierella alpina]|uniref:Uncharacterized protein n=1 Tax=Mortierella alpina TaxID=64518 RepID=A0A9P8AA20_MORAP|nr:hypothetical protein KVV02_008693 [Mortierella alpina]
MSSVQLPSIQTNFAVYPPSSSSPLSPPSTMRRAHRSVSPGCAAPAMTFQTRSYSTSSLLSTYSSSSERSLSQSPGPATPCGMMSRSPSFTDQQASISGTHYNDGNSNNCINNKPLFPVPVHQQPHKQAHHYSSYAGHPACPPLPSLYPSSHRYPPSTARHHPYQQPHLHQQQHPRHPMQSTSSDHDYHPSPRQGYTLPPLIAPHHRQHWSPAYSRTPPSPSSPQESTYSYPARDRSDHNPHHDHPNSLYKQHPQQHPERSSFGYKSSSNTSNYFHSTTPPPPPYYPLIAAPEHEDRVVALNPSSTPPCSPVQAIRGPSLVGEGGDDNEEEDADEDDDADEDESEEDEEEKDDDADRSDSPSSFMSRSRSFSRDGSSCSPEPSASSGYLGSMSDASVSTTSLMSSSTSSSSSSCSASNVSMTPVPTTTQLLLCPVCSRAFKPSKNQNCNLRRHLKNVHNMSPAIHPRKCKWDSLPDGRVKDDKDRKERTRKSKRLWARKFRQRRKVEEAAVVLSMLSQAL